MSIHCHWPNRNLLSLRSRRGGAFYDPPSLLRSDERFWHAPEDSQYNLGFRPARTFR